MTPQEICTVALKRIGACAAGETPAFDLLNDAYLRLNAMLDLWATQRLTINGLQKFSKAVTQGHNPYTIGVGGDFNQARPIWIGVVTMTLPGTIPSDIPVEIVDVKTYAAMVASKTTQAQISQLAYYDQAGPTLGNLNLFPIPNDATVLINIWVPVALVQFTSLTQSITLLPGYQSALEYNLAADLMPEWGRPLDPSVGALVMEKAGETLGWIKRSNMTPTILWADPGMLKPGAIVGGGSWYTGP